jgi:hypothetical protein
VAALAAVAAGQRNIAASRAVSNSRQMSLLSLDSERRKSQRKNPEARYPSRFAFYAEIEGGPNKCFYHGKDGGKRS